MFQVYYWDSYWIILGLLHCEMFETVRGMLLNFVHLVKVTAALLNGERKREKEKESERKREKVR